MSENNLFMVGLDVGTENVRAVALATNEKGNVSVAGYNEGKSAGMRKGVPANLAGPAGAIDMMLGDVERISGREVNSADVSINGSQLLTTRVEGMIAVGTAEHEISEEDLVRVEDVAVTGRIPANRVVLMVVPLEYAVDGQWGIKDPIGMSGARLEMRACVVSALAPNYDNLKKVTTTTGVEAIRVVPAVVAAAKAVLSERQRENGVAVVDFGATTTSVAVFEEGELQYVGVVPAGSNNITNDLAIVLAIDTAMAEEIKEMLISADFREERTPVVKIRGRAFERKEVEAVVEARLAEIFAEVRKHLKVAKYDQRLPEGIVLTGGGAKMKGVTEFAKEAFAAAVKIGTVMAPDRSFKEIERPEFATAVGLALMAIEDGGRRAEMPKKRIKKVKNTQKEGFLKRILGRF